MQRPTRRHSAVVSRSPTSDIYSCWPDASTSDGGNDEKWHIPAFPHSRRPFATCLARSRHPASARPAPQYDRDWAASSRFREADRRKRTFVQPASRVLRADPIASSAGLPDATVGHVSASLSLSSRYACWWGKIDRGQVEPAKRRTGRRPRFGYGSCGSSPGLFQTGAEDKRATT